MTAIATVGSICSHGGAIVTGAPTVTASGLPVAIMGSLLICDIHGPQTMISTSTVTAGGMPVVRVGLDFATCGAVIVTGSPTIDVES